MSGSILFYKYKIIDKIIWLGTAIQCYPEKDVYRVRVRVLILVHVHVHVHVHVNTRIWRVLYTSSTRNTLILRVILIK